MRIAGIIRPAISQSTLIGPRLDARLELLDLTPMLPPVSH
jgi:hypothetical protein